MTRLISILLIPFIVLTACVDTGQSVTQPLTGHSSGWHDGGNAEDICHKYLILMGIAQIMYYGVHCEFADNIEDLEKFIPLPIESVYCPVNGEYIFTVDDNGYSITCPTNEIMSHGYIQNGVVSWPPNPSEYLEYCQSNMMSLTTACSMYYGIYNRFPEKLCDLGISGVMDNWDLMCPACSLLYIYETDVSGQTFTIHCPLPTDPNHGSVVDGIPSWE